jgi:hypothetical protein
MMRLRANQRFSLGKPNLTTSSKVHHPKNMNARLASFGRIGRNYSGQLTTYLVKNPEKALLLKFVEVPDSWLGA